MIGLLLLLSTSLLSTNLVLSAKIEYPFEVELGNFTLISQHSSYDVDEDGNDVHSNGTFCFRLTNINGETTSWVPYSGFNDESKTLFEFNLMMEDIGNNITQVEMVTITKDPLLMISLFGGEYGRSIALANEGDFWALGEADTGIYISCTYFSVLDLFGTGEIWSYTSSSLIDCNNNNDNDPFDEEGYQCIGYPSDETSTITPVDDDDSYSIGFYSLFNKNIIINMVIIIMYAFV